MRTTLNIDDATIGELQRYFKDRSRTAAVNEALKQ